MTLGFEVGRLVGSFQTDALGQGRRIAHLQTQPGVGRMVALVLARVNAEEHRARGVARTHDVTTSAGDIPDEPRINRACMVLLVTVRRSFGTLVLERS